MQTAFQFLRESEGLTNTTNFSVPLTPAIYDTDVLHRLQTDGYDINEVLQTINYYIDNYPANNTLVYGALLRMDMIILAGGLQVCVFY